MEDEYSRLPNWCRVIWTLDVVVLEDRQGGSLDAGKQEDLPFNLIASAYANILAARERPDPDSGQTKTSAALFHCSRYCDRASLSAGCYLHEHRRALLIYSTSHGLEAADTTYTSSAKVRSEKGVVPAIWVR